jgi:hypothetical protein
MSRLQRERHLKKLDELLSKADDEAFCQLVWAIDALQSDRVGEASPFIRFPGEAATMDIMSDRLIHKWELDVSLTAVRYCEKKTASGAERTSKL